MKARTPFWKKKWGDKMCGISHSRLRPGKNKFGLSYTIFLDCSHGFYRSLLIEWVKNCPTVDPTCPMCRKTFECAKCFTP